MTFRDNALAILNYEKYEEMPIVSFGYWGETVDKWYNEGHITKEEAEGYKNNGDNSEADNSIMKKLGFDFNWNSCLGTNNGLFPHFEEKILEVYEDGSRKLVNSEGLIVKDKPGTVTIPAEIGTSLVSREIWEKEYLPRMKFSEERVNKEYLSKFKDDTNRIVPVGIHCGSLIGTMRNYLGVEELSYLYADDEDLYVEIIDTFGNLAYNCAKSALETGAKFDYGHFWEDICYKNGPLVTPSVFEKYVGPHYKKITALLNSYGINIISVDCDGMIDSLIPIWLKNGVNTMFPIEVGTWSASIKPWKEQYGNNIKGVGGTNKTVFAKDFASVDVEIKRLKNLVDLGGYIPCPDHRIAPDAIFENVRYYCQELRKVCKK